MKKDKLGYDGPQRNLIIAGNIQGSHPRENPPGVVTDNTEVSHVTFDCSDEQMKAHRFIISQSAKGFVLILGFFDLLSSGLLVYFLFDYVSNCI